MARLAAERHQRWSFHPRNRCSQFPRGGMRCRSIGAVILTPPAVALAAPSHSRSPVEAPPTPAVPRTNATATRAANATRPANATATRPANATATRPANATATRPANATATRAPPTRRRTPRERHRGTGGQRDRREAQKAADTKKKKKKPQLAKANVTEALSKNNMVVKRQESLLTEFVVDPITGDSCGN